MAQFHSSPVPVPAVEDLFSLDASPQSYLYSSKPLHFDFYDTANQPLPQFTPSPISPVSPPPANQRKKSTKPRQTPPKSVVHTPAPVSDAETAEQRAARDPEKRAEQNRKAQKNFREKKLREMRELEEKAKKAEEEKVVAELLKQENADLRSIIASLRKENEKLIEEKTQLMNFTWNAQLPPSFGASLITKGELVVYDQAEQPELGDPSSSSPPSDPIEAPLSSPSSLPSNDSRSSSPPLAPSQFQKAHINYSTDEHLHGLPLSEQLSYFESSVPYSPLSTLLGNPSAFEESKYEIPEEVIRQPQFQQLQDAPSFDALDDLFPESAQWGANVIDLLNIPQTQKETEEPKKRTLQDADVYRTDPPLVPKTIWSKNERFEKDYEETELCELLKKTHCKDRNPELCHGAKYMKKAM